MYSARGKITWPARKRLSAWSPLNVSCCQYLSFRKPYHTPRILQDVAPWAQTWAATVSRSTVVLLTHCISGNKGLVTSDYLHTFIYSYAHVTMVNFCIKNKHLVNYTMWIAFAPVIYGTRYTKSLRYIEFNYTFYMWNFQFNDVYRAGNRVFITIET